MLYAWKKVNVVSVIMLFMYGFAYIKSISNYLIFMDY